MHGDNDQIGRHYLFFQHPEKEMVWSGYLIRRIADNALLRVGDIFYGFFREEPTIMMCTLRATKDEEVECFPAVEIYDRFELLDNFICPA